MARVLIVDDQKSVLLTLEALLTKSGHSVVSCTNAIDALSVLMAEPMDLMITDAIMPGGSDGYALTRTVRKESKISKLPIILLTGKRERADIEKGIQSGVNDYVVKPLDPDLLMAKVNHLLPNGEQTHVDFAQAAVKAKAEWDSKTEIIGVSELGFQIQSNIPMPLGKVLRLKSPLFDEIGIPVLPVRIDTCENLNESEYFRIEAHFVGVTEKELSPLRLWIRSKR